MKKILICMLSLALFCFCGCKKEAEITPIIDSTLETEVNKICQTIATLDMEMNSIEPDNETACSEMLDKLSDMEELFIQFASLDFTDNFSYLQQYAVEARNYMSEAVGVYREIYSISEYESSKDDYAKENYRRAFKRLHAILAVLRGENPSNE